MAKKALSSSSDTPKRRRKRMMSDAEVITILICFHFNSYRNFKHYYLGCVRVHWKHLFGKTGADWDSAPERTGTLLMRQS